MSPAENTVATWYANQTSFLKDEEDLVEERGAEITGIFQSVRDWRLQRKP